MLYWFRAKSSICHHYILFFHPQLAFHAAHTAVFLLNRSLFIYWKAEKCHRWHSLAAFNTLRSSLNCCRWKPESPACILKLQENTFSFLQWALQFKEIRNLDWERIPYLDLICFLLILGNYHIKSFPQMNWVPFNIEWGVFFLSTVPIGMLFPSLIYLRGEKSYFFSPPVLFSYLICSLHFFLATSATSVFQILSQSLSTSTACSLALDRGQKSCRRVGCHGMTIIVWQEVQLL